MFPDANILNCGCNLQSDSVEKEKGTVGFFTFLSLNDFQIQFGQFRTQTMVFLADAEDLTVKLGPFCLLHIPTYSAKWKELKF